MMQWQIDYYKAFLKPGLDTMLQPANSMIDNYVWWWLQWYYLPMRMPEYGSDVDRFISQFSLNGIKSNLCQAG
jgi:hypothetical protein